ncbi:hypothetical protein G7044_05090 [Paracoccus sp. 12-3]|nr:hypothetical protein [Paracoccus xiamenensis]
MPGLVTAIAVAEGDTLEIGQSLVTIEAMKMENILRAGRKARVAKIRPALGDSLSVDDIIMELD